MESETKVSCHDFGPSKTVQNVKQTEQDICVHLNKDLSQNCEGSFSVNSILQATRGFQYTKQRFSISFHSSLFYFISKNTQGNYPGQNPEHPCFTLFQLISICRQQEIFHFITLQLFISLVGISSEILLFSTQNDDCGSRHSRTVETGNKNHCVTEATHVLRRKLRKD